MYLSPKFLNIGATNDTYQEFSKEGYLRHTLKNSDSVPDSSRWNFLEKFLANNLALSDTEDNTSRPLNREGIADSPLLRTSLAICRKSWEASFWEVMDSFVLLTYWSLEA